MKAEGCTISCQREKEETEKGMREEGRKQEEGLEKGEEDEEKESQVSLKGCSQ